MNDLNQTLLRYEEYDPYPLQFSIRPDRLFSFDKSKTLADDILKAASGSWEVRTVGPQCADTIPEEKGLYVFAWRPYFRLHQEDGKSGSFRFPLYVGIAVGGDNNLRKRFKSEYKYYAKKNPRIHWEKPHEKRSRQNMLKRYLNVWELEYWFVVVTEEETAKFLETRLVRLLDPPVNNNLKAPRARLGEPIKAF